MYRVECTDKGKRLISRKVVQYNKNTRRRTKVWNTITEASRALGIDASSITKCCKGLRATAGNYIWLYLSDVELIKSLKNYV